MLKRNTSKQKKINYYQHYLTILTFSCTMIILVNVQIIYIFSFILQIK